MKTDKKKFKSSFGIRIKNTAQREKDDQLDKSSEQVKNCCTLLKI